LLFFNILNNSELNALAKFIVTEWGDTVDSGIGFSYRPASPMLPGGPVQQPYAGVNFILPVRDYEFGYCSPEAET
jgi:hypothetical protein